MQRVAKRGMSFSDEKPIALCIHFFFPGARQHLLSVFFLSSLFPVLLTAVVGFDASPLLRPREPVWPDEYLIRRDYPIASAQYGMHNEARGGRVKNAAGPHL